MRALMTASSGMRGQQLNVDVISHNLANVNTYGYKKQRVEFKDLLYETLSRSSAIDGKGKPVNLQVGLGAAPVSTQTSYSAGSLVQTENSIDFAIDGNGFFAVRTDNDKIMYTKDGSFKLSMDNGTKTLVTSEGYYVLSSDDSEIDLTDINIDDLSVDSQGNISYTDEEGEIQSTGLKLKIVQFQNMAGLLKVGPNLVDETVASGEPIDEELLGNKSRIMQGFLENSNVQIVEEMVNLIVAQRAYEINSKSIQTADDMLSMANNLRR
jgi:flagellar basal-body rod protein FlgG